MGPMEARTTLAGRLRPAASSRATRLVAVEALVKVMASGQLAGIAEEGSDGLERRRRDAVTVGCGDGDLAAGGLEPVA